MKIDRIIGILSILLQKEKVTSSELAEKFEVSRRTIIRDIEDIEKAGIPIVTFQGQGGGISIMEGFKIDRILLSKDDMKAILAGLGSLDSISKTKRYRQLMSKLSSEYSDMLNSGNQIIIDLASWDKSVVSDKIELIKNAIDNHQKIRFTYFSPTGKSQREIEPYHLIFQWSNWYVWGYCIFRNDYRMFKLTRINDLELSGIINEKREVPEYIIHKLQYTKGGDDITVKFDKSLKWRIIDEFGIEISNSDDKDDIFMTFQWSDIPAFYKYILSFGDKAEIISPEKYRQEFKELVKKTLKKYQI